MPAGFAADAPATLAALLAAAACMFVAGGVVKGTLGVGLPLVVVPLLTLLFPASQAMGLLVMPVLLSNLLQAVEGGRLRYALRRFAPLMLAQLVATLLANHWSAQLSARGMNAVIAFTVISAVAVMVLQPKGEVTPRQERWAGPLVGAIAGALGGASSLTGPILITYLMALRLPRDEFIGSISIIYLLGAIPMYAAMLAWGRFGWEPVAWSCLALVPMYLGLRVGGAIRSRLSETLFRRALFAFLTLLALLLLVK
ncbi:sulfite exporter TauE/SafE family protein [Ramlibacter sp. MAHUQ-53]|uniref:sulfite exporter TauE/SafE family protein n=1 Tax=unclassified Ramlibacter TaxID=2617605 RepID=UPI003640E045